MPEIRNLDHTRDLASSAKRRATRRVQDLGTTANLPPALRNPEWLADLEYVWRMRTADALRLLDLRARTQRRAARVATVPTERVVLSRSSEWAEHRAQAMALPRAELIATCGKRFRTVRCGCGPREIPVGCDQTLLCPRCSKRHWRVWRRRVTRSMDAHVRAARAKWASCGRPGKLPGVYLVTLTIPHSGSIASDRAALGRAWRKLTKVASAEGWWSAYVMVYEVTPGNDGLGHVHMHLAAVSSWIPYDRLHEVWRRVAGALVLDVSAPRSGRVQKAADYISKYVTKGVEPGVFTGQKAGELLVAVRGKRKVSTSVDFWKPERDRERHCKRCGERHRSLGAPPALRKVAPAAVLKAIAERVGWWVPRGAVQVVLQL